MSSVTEVTDQTFQTEVLESDTPAVVDFWAPWCMPCRMVAPAVEELAEEYDGKVKFGKLNTDEARDTAMKFGITAIPTLLLFKGGQVARKVVGVKSKQDLKKEIEAVLG